MTILTVGTGKQFATLSAAVSASHDGDLIQVQAGTYTNDFSTITTKITIQGIGGLAILAATVEPTNGRAILETDTNVTLDHVALTGAQDTATNSSANGAGVLARGGNLTINASYIHGNQEGVLVGPDVSPNGAITITNTEFANNGSNNGFTHNIYISAAQQATLVGNYFTGAQGGHEIKDGAANSLIQNNIIADGTSSSGSYSIDLFNGGANVVAGNTIEKGPNSVQGTFIHYGIANAPAANASLAITGNTFIDDKTAGALPYLLLNESNGGAQPVLNNNSVFNAGSIPITPANGPATVTNLTNLASEPAFPSAAAYLASNVMAASVDIVGAPAGFGITASSGAASNLFNGVSFSVADDAPVGVVLSGWTAGTVSYAGGDASINVTTPQAGTIDITGTASKIFADFAAGLFTYLGGPAATDKVTVQINSPNTFLDATTGSAAVIESAFALNVFAGGTGNQLPNLSASLSPAGSAALAAAVAGLSPGAKYNVVTSANGTTSQPPVAGDLNAVVAGAAAAGSTLSLPAGYNAAYLAGGSAATLIDSAGGSLLVATVANSTVFGANNDTIIAGNAGALVVAGGGAETVVGGNGGSVMFLGSGSDLVTSVGADTIVGGSGSATVNASGNPLYFGTSGSTVFNAGAGAATVVGGTGGNTFTGGSGPGLFFAATSGPTTYNPGTGVDTVVGFGGGLTATGGSSGALIFGGANVANNLSTGTGSSTVVGFGTGDNVTATGPGNNLIEVAGPSSTVNGGGSTGSNTYFAFGANDVIATGSGASAVAVESAAGNTTLVAGSGPSTFYIVAAAAARTVTFQNFNGGDVVTLQFYPGGTGASALSQASISGGNETVSLPDGTQLVFQGFTGLNPSNFG